MDGNVSGGIWVCGDGLHVEKLNGKEDFGECVCVCVFWEIMEMKTVEMFSDGNFAENIWCLCFVLSYRAAPALNPTTVKHDANKWHMDIWVVCLFV